MGEVPRLFESWEEYHRELLMGLAPFDFHIDKAYFTASGKEIEAAELDPFTFNTYELEIEDKGPKTAAELLEHPLHITYDGRLIGGPKLHDYAKLHIVELAEELPELMYKVFISVFGNPDAVPFLKDSGGHRGFRAGAQENGAISLQVFGECACLNPSQAGYSTGFEGLEKGFAEYELHNTDFQAQRIGLYAGLGHLAKLASQA